MPFLLEALQFDDATHTYRVGDVVLPSVTQILDLIPPRATVLQFCRREELEAKRQLGTAVHSACHFCDEGTLDLSTVDPAVEPYLVGWQRFRRESDFQVSQLETMVCHPTLGYAGRFDRLGFLNGKKTLADLKTGDAKSAAADIQTAAYVEALLATAGAWEPIARLSIKLCPDGTYKLFQHDNRRDFEVFKAALSIWNYNHAA